MGKIWGVFASIIATLGVLLGMYVTLSKPSPDINVYISDGIFYTPPQYNDLVVSSYRDSGWEGIYSVLDSMAKDVDFAVKENAVDKLQKIMRGPFSKPFEKGLQEYRKLIFLAVKNEGDALAKNVYVDFPESVLIRVEDDKKESQSEPDLIKRYEISSIRQNGMVRIWAWSKSDEFNKYEIRVGSENEIAKIKYAREFTDFRSIISIYFSELVLFLFIVSVLIFAFFLWKYVDDKEKVSDEVK